MKLFIWHDPEIRPETQAQIDRAASLYRAGMTDHAAIGAEIGRGEQTVRAYLAAAGIEVPKAKRGPRNPRGSAIHLAHVSEFAFVSDPITFLKGLLPAVDEIDGSRDFPLRFDPARLFKDFGRERVLAVWDALPAEKRPETAAEFREILRLGIPS